MERAEKGAKNEEMTEKVRMICKVCGGEIDYQIDNSCPYCGLIWITCKKCGYEYAFGE